MRRFDAHGRADPAIRDFMGLAENDWDFTDPTAMPGFGALPPGTDVKKLVAQIFGEARQRGRTRRRSGHCDSSRSAVAVGGRRSPPDSRGTKFHCGSQSSESDIAQRDNDTAAHHRWF